jgi:hypothetical protein
MVVVVSSGSLNIAAINLFAAFVSIEVSTTPSQEGTSHDDDLSIAPTHA